jgi:hypothetical protein
MGNCKEDRLHTYNAFVQQLLLCKSNKYYIFWECVCSLRLPSMQCICAIIYCHLWLSRLYNIIPHSLTNGTIFRKRFLNITRVLIFSETFAWNISFSNKSIKFNENLSSRSRSCSTRTDGQTDRHDEAESRFSEFCKRTYEQEVATDLEMGRGWWTVFYFCFIFRSSCLWKFSQRPAYLTGVSCGFFVEPDKRRSSVVLSFNCCEKTLRFNYKACQLSVIIDK